MTDAITTEIREILTDVGRLGVDVGGLADTDDLYRAGLTTHASVTVMLACEDAFDVEFTPDLLKKSTFGSIAALREALVQVGAEDAVAS